MSSVIKTAISFLGFGGEEVQSPARNEPTRAQAASKVTVLRTRRQPADGNEIFTIEPNSYQEAGEIAEQFRSGVSVIVNMAHMSEVDCRRMVDYMTGLQHALEGHFKRVTSKVFVLTPAGVGINDEAESVLSEDDLLIQP